MSAQPFHMKSARKLASIEECVVDRPFDGLNSWRFLLNSELFVDFIKKTGQIPYRCSL